MIGLGCKYHLESIAVPGEQDVRGVANESQNYFGLYGMQAKKL